MKKLFLLFTVILFLSGCSSETGNNSLLTTDEGVPVSSRGREYKGLEKADWSHAFLFGDTLYYAQSVMGEETGWKVFACSREGQAKEIARFDSPKQHFINFAVDREGSLYYLYMDETQNSIYLQKNTSDGSLIYLTDAGSLEEMGLLEEDTDAQMVSESGRKWYDITEMEATEKGQVCLYSRSHNTIFLFDSDAGYLSTINTIHPGENVTSLGLVNAGENGICFFFYQAEDHTLHFQKLDWQNRSLQNAVSHSLVDDGAGAGLDPADLPLWVMVNSGYDYGILIYARDTLWQYDPVGDELFILLGGAEPYVDLSGDIVKYITLLDNNRIFAVVLETFDDTFRQIEIKPEYEVPELRTVTIGNTDNTGNIEWLRNTIYKYNKNNQNNILVELKTYTQDGLFMDLLKGEGPDILDLRRLPWDSLASKGILEDLSPYMERSRVLQEEDLHPGVVRNYYYDDKMLFIFPSFHLKTLVVSVNDFALDSGWTIEELLDLAEANPALPVVSNFHKDKTLFLIQFLLAADMDSFIDWKKQECNFDSDRFISILERVDRLKFDDTSISGTDINEVYYTNQERFFNQEYLLDIRIFSLPINAYVLLKSQLENVGSIVSYPVRDKIPYFIMDTTNLFSINSASDNKEEAWFFLEYLLSEEYQSKTYSGISDFPVHRDIFEEQIKISFRDLPESKPYTGPVPPADEEIHARSEEKRNILRETEVTDADIEDLKFMIDHAYLDSSVIHVLGSDAWITIFIEEAAAFFAGDRSAEETARIIQGRVTLMLYE